MALARTVLTSPQQDALMQRMEPLHPRSLGSLPPDVRERVTSEHEADVTELLSMLDQLDSQHAQHGLDKDAVLRLLLVLRFNAHYSGLYITSGKTSSTCASIYHRLAASIIIITRCMCVRATVLQLDYSLHNIVPPIPPILALREPPIIKSKSAQVLTYGQVLQRPCLAP